MNEMMSTGEMVLLAIPVAAVSRGMNIGEMVLLAIAVAAAVVLTLFLYRRRFLGTGWAGPLGCAAWLCAAAVTTDRLGMLTGRRNIWQSSLQSIMRELCAGLLIVFAVPFVVRLFGKWLGKSIDDLEKAPGAQGVRAWLSGPNVLLAVAISLCAWQGWAHSAYSFWGVLAITV
ncbi:unnamed protein product, partial [marine sediment metagenome]